MRRIFHCCTIGGETKRTKEFSLVEQNHTTRGVRVPDFSGSGRADNFRAGSGGVPILSVLLEIPKVSGFRDSIRATSITAMSGQFDFQVGSGKLGRDRTISLPVID